MASPAPAGGCCRRKRAARYPGEIGPDVVDALDRQGFMDVVRIERAMTGSSGTLNRAEAEELVVRLAQSRRMGLSMIQAHTGYSRSQIAAILAKRKARALR